MFDDDDFWKFEMLNGSSGRDSCSFPSGGKIFLVVVAIVVAIIVLALVLGVEISWPVVKFFLSIVLVVGVFVFLNFIFSR